MKRLEHVRVLMYSHDTFGLGHLRRCRTIAHSLVEDFKGLHVLIISGSPIAGAFDFKVRVDFVKIPSVIKLHNGEYTSIDRHIELDETLRMRTAMLRDTAKSFDPDIFIVDKEPLGLRGELEDTLNYLKATGCTLVLGLRDVLDSPELLAQEWQRKDMLRRIDALYNEIWVYGPERFWNPLNGLDVPASIEARMTYTGYLERTVPYSLNRSQRSDGDYILVTTGGGGDGADLLRQVLAAYEHDRDLPIPALMVLGPFMPADEREEISRRAERTGRVSIIEFDSRIEKLMTDSQGLVGMCGYNTFCELLSFNKRALMVPRISPRMEQHVRASRAAELGLVDMLQPSEAVDPAVMAAALRRLPHRPLPSEIGYEHMMMGLEVVNERVQRLIARRAGPQLSVIEGGL
ncbi:MAG: glycosyltransferase family protein [Parvibaculaceae bacterium]